MIHRNGDMLLCRLSNQVQKPYQGLWTLPGGGLEFGEHPEEGMIREVEEETGLVVAPASLLGINSFTIHGENDDFHSIQIVYEAQVLRGALRYEKDGTTDMCHWHSSDSVGALAVVELVTKALEFKR